MSYPLGNHFEREVEKEERTHPMTIQRISSRSGGIGGRLPPVPLYSGGEGHGGGERVFFDDGRVKVTESLVTIGPPWNKAFVVSQIRGVTYGKNRSTDLSNSMLKLVGTVLIFAGVLSLAAGFTVGFFAGVFTGIGVLWNRPKPDAPYCVTLDFGDTWATEYLSTANERWAEAVAGAVVEAMRYDGEDAPDFIPGPRETRN